MNVLLPTAAPMLLLAAQKLGLILARTAGLFTLSPLGHEIVPAAVRVAAAVVVSLALWPVVPEPAAGDFVMQILAEGAAGLLAALLSRLPLLGIEAGLQVASVSAGLGIASLFDPATEDEVHPTTELLSLAGLLIFFSVGGHHMLLIALHHSLQAVPPGSARLDRATCYAVLRLSSEFFVLMIAVAAPMLLLSLALHVALALVSRAAPAVNILSVSLVAVLLACLWMFIRGLPGLGQQIREAIDVTAGHYLLGLAR